jgi:hypothetical protein
MATSRFPLFMFNPLSCAKGPWQVTRALIDLMQFRMVYLARIAEARGNSINGDEHFAQKLRIITILLAQAA